MGSKLIPQYIIKFFDQIIVIYAQKKNANQLSSKSYFVIHANSWFQ